MTRYPRDMLGHGQTPPDAHWPGGARIALSLVLNYEEGGENNVLHGDPASEAFLSDITGAQPWPGQRHWNMESLYEYGARAGFWRLHRMLRDTAVTVFGVATALARSPLQVEAMLGAGWEIASHGLKWIEHKDMTPDDERAAIRDALALHQSVTGAAPHGWYTGRCSDNTVRLVAEEVNPDYISDSYADDLPYYVRIDDRPQLILPYTLDANDMRFAIQAGHPDGASWEQYLRDSFDCLYAEGGRMMSVGLHCRLAGRPGRAQALGRFLDYVRSHEGVWIATRAEICTHWGKVNPPNSQNGVFPDDLVRDAIPALSDRPVAAGDMAHELDRDAFVARFGGIFEHSPWVAERAFEMDLGPAHHHPAGLHSVLVRAFRAAQPLDRMTVLIAHPDLAGKLAAAGELTEDSSSEQASVGLDLLTNTERETFEELNAAYVRKHGFPFIIAVRDYDKPAILAAFGKRIENDTETEFDEACRQVERIARLRLEAMRW
ncbi:MAG: allantoinase PuuE [Jannaschia sp.]